VSQRQRRYRTFSQTCGSANANGEGLNGSLRERLTIMSEIVSEKIVNCCYLFIHASKQRAGAARFEVFLTILFTLFYSLFTILTIYSQTLSHDCQIFLSKNKEAHQN
jgi:hypothetical protein